MKTNTSKVQTRILLLTILLMSSLGHATCFEETDSLQENDFKVDLLRYHPSGTPTRTLIIFPPTGRTNYIDKSYAKTFCSNGYDVVILSQWTKDEGDDGDLGSHQRYYERAQLVMKLVLGKTKTPFIGVLGTSLGALFASMSASLYPQLNAVFTIVGGAPISSIIAESDQKALIGLYEKRKKEFGFRDQTEYANELDRRIQLDPLKMPRPSPNTNLGMVIAEGDTTVPAQFQKQLAEFWKPGHLTTLSGGHAYVIIKTWLFHTNEILDFFNKSSPNTGK